VRLYPRHAWGARRYAAHARIFASLSPDTRAHKGTQFAQHHNDLAAK
jgi:hypothetical protein